jgi:predicted adenylyl cyclase CyaB
MAKNIEIKARVRDFEKLRKRAAAASDTAAELLHQEDTFFHSPKGRLKLRALAPDHGELIYYERADSAGPKQSNYFLSVTAEPERLKDVLAKSLGVRGVVRKDRWLYLAGNTRIHLDQVEGLGAFMELEVVMSDGQNPAEGQAIANELMTRLGINESDLIEGAYIDLLESG